MVGEVRGEALTVPRRLTALLDPLTRGWLVVLGASLGQLALGFVASVLISRSLGPAGFGAFTVLAAVAGIGGAVAEAGLSSAAVSRVAETWAADVRAAHARGQSFFWIRLSLALGLAVAGILAARPLARDLLGLSVSDNLLRLALIGVVATALSGAVNTILQAIGHFGRLTVAMLSNAGLTALLAVALALTGRLTLVTALVVLGIGTSLVSFAVGCRLLPSGMKPAAPALAEIREESGPLLRFGGWLWLANVAAMLLAWLDVLLVNRWAPAEVGVYALASSLASKANVVNNSLYTVLLPAASALSTGVDTRRYIRQGLLRSLAISLLLLPLIPLSTWLCPLIYGGAFRPAVPLFQLLLGVAIFDVFTTPLLLLAFPMKQPKLIAGADGLRLVTLAAAAAWLIPIYGPFGAVAARFLARVAGCLLTLAVLAYQTRPPVAALPNVE